MYRCVYILVHRYVNLEHYEYGKQLLLAKIGSDTAKNEPPKRFEIGVSKKAPTVQNTVACSWAAFISK